MCPAQTTATMDWGEIYERLQANRGDYDAYASLQERVRGLLTRRLGAVDPSTLDDGCNDTCTAILLKLDTVRLGPRGFYPFVVGHVRNTVNRIIRARRRDRSIFQALVGVGGGGGNGGTEADPQAVHQPHIPEETTACIA